MTLYVGLATVYNKLITLHRVAKDGTRFYHDVMLCIVSYMYIGLISTYTYIHTYRNI